MTSSAISTVLGYPRIGPKRELKHAIEHHWSNKLSTEELLATQAEIRRGTWQHMRDAGLDEVPVGISSLYDQMLDSAVLFGAIPERFRAPTANPIDTYFALARGTAELAPLEMTKWFDTNYHYVVPELDEGTQFQLSAQSIMDELVEAKAFGIRPRPVFVGPVTFLLLSKGVDGADSGFRPLDLLEPLLDQYLVLLTQLADAGVGRVQLDEPALVTDLSRAELAAVEKAYQRLGTHTHRPDILVSTYFGDLDAALPVLAAAPIEAIGVDLVAGRTNLASLERCEALTNKTIYAGVVNGRNVWRTDLRETLRTCERLSAFAKNSSNNIVVTSSCSLLHVPVDVALETNTSDASTANLDDRVRPWLAFARQKLAEVASLTRGLNDGPDAIATQLSTSDAVRRDRQNATWASQIPVRQRSAALSKADASRASAYERRAATQRARLGPPLLPTTTIGSFPQTANVRKARAALRAGRIDLAEYTTLMREEVDRAIAMQEDVGLDVLVHGEPERNDMVQYFAEQLVGFASTQYGWVQSYGTRCVRPPIIYGDVSRPSAMTLDWTGYAQSRTSKPVKGMLTGPVTMLAWSFVRDDQPLAETARQVALALRDEVSDLEAAGTAIIQVDEPALRETLPLRGADRPGYLQWAVTAFRIATSGVRDDTQIHTHMCYSEFGEIVEAIDALDADVTTVEAARSHMHFVTDLAKANYQREIGPGVYDIHSPRVPSLEEVTDNVEQIVAAIGAERVWINPDCGLKTRGYEEVEASLRNLVGAARLVRARLQSKRPGA